MLQPFGEGLITVVVPQLRRGENSLLLWNIGNQNTPVHTFVGHTDVVLEFDWRRFHEGNLMNYFPSFMLVFLVSKFLVYSELCYLV